MHFLSVLRLMIFAEIPFCPSINLEQPVMVQVLLLTYQLSCGMRYLILSVPLSLLVLKKNPGPHFVQRLFFLIKIILQFYVFSYVSVDTMYFSCKCLEDISPACTYSEIRDEIKFIYHMARTAPRALSL